MPKPMLTKKEIKRTIDAMPKLEAEHRRFFNALAKESDRSAVVLAAERVNLALFTLLKAYFVKPLTKAEQDNPEKDELFRAFAPLSTFSARIIVAHRLGLIDSKSRKAIELIKGLRNSFAHATEVDSLASKHHTEKVYAIRDLGTEGPAKLDGDPSFKGGTIELSIFLSSVSILLFKIETLTLLVRPAYERISMIINLDHGGGE